MRLFTWFLFTSLILIIGADIYFYKYVYLPQKLYIKKLEEANVKLKYRIKGEIELAYKNCIERFKADSIRKAAQEKAQKLQAQTQLFPMYFAFSYKTMFTPSGKLSSKGKTLLKEFYKQMKGQAYDSIRIFINRRHKHSAKKVLGIKKYLVSLGMDRNKVWARLADTIPKDSIRIYIVR